MIALQGNFDQALDDRPRARRAATRSGSSTPSTRSGSRGRRRRRSRSLEELGALDALSIPVGNAGNITAYWKGFQEAGAAPRMLGWQAAGAAPLVRGRAGRRARDGRERDPHRQPRALGGGDGRDERVRRRRSARSPTSRSSTPTASWPPTRASSASRRRRPASPGLLAHGAEGARAGRLRAHRPRAQGPADRAVRRPARSCRATPTTAAVERVLFG